MDASSSHTAACVLLFSSKRAEGGSVAVAEGQGVRTKDTAKWLLAVTRAARTGKWATTMTRVAISVASRTRKSWAVIGFLGPGGRESKGVVDLIAIRRDHKLNRGFKRGDLFEIVLIQVKGGTAPRPTVDDVRRLRAVKRFYRAREVLLAEWHKGKGPEFSKLTERTPASFPRQAWERVDAAVVFH